MNAVVGGLTAFFVPTQLLAIVALGLLAGESARPLLHSACLAVGLAIGSLAIALAIREQPAALALLGIAALAGFAVVLVWTPPLVLSGALALAAGAALAINSPPQSLTIANAVEEQIATGVAAIAMFVLVALIAAKAERPWQRISVRIAGSWIAASAILVLALRLAR
jgi:urease accessory protein